MTIRDTSRQGVLPAHKVLRYSSNIGMAKIGLELGSPTLYKYLRALGFGESTCVPVADSRGILRQPRSWSEADLMSASFGQSVSVTALQMAQGYLTMVSTSRCACCASRSMWNSVTSASFRSASAVRSWA